MFQTLRALWVAKVLIPIAARFLPRNPYRLVYFLEACGFEDGQCHSNPTHGSKEPKYAVRIRRLAEAEYLTFSNMLREEAETEKHAMTVEIIRLIALTDCRRSEIIGLKWGEVDLGSSCLRLIDSNEGNSVLPIGLPVVECVEERRKEESEGYVFPGARNGAAFESFQNHWEQIFRKSLLADVTPHILRHSFASIANDLGFTEITIAALIGHSKGTMTSRYIQTLVTRS